MKSYLIIREDYFNEKGISNNVHFCIKESKKFLWFKWWGYVKYEECYGSGSYNTVLKFKNLPEAETFINEVLMKNGPRQKWSAMILKKIEKK